MGYSRETRGRGLRPGGGAGGQFHGSQTSYHLIRPVLSWGSNLSTHSLFRAPSLCQTLTSYAESFEKLKRRYICHHSQVRTERRREGGRLKVPQLLSSEARIRPQHTRLSLTTLQAFPRLNPFHHCLNLTFGHSRLSQIVSAKDLPVN